MEKIKDYMLPENKNSIYHKEASSTIGLTRELAGKINEIVDFCNKFYADDLKWKQDQEGIIRKGVVFMKDNLVNSLQELMDILEREGFVENRIYTYTRDIVARLDNLLGAIKEGSTSLDVELIDGRTGADNVNYNSLGESIREQIKKLETLVSSNFLVKAYGNFFDGETEEGWVTPEGFVVREGFARTSPIYLTPGRYVSNTVVSTFTEGHGEMIARVNSEGDLLELITGIPNENDQKLLFNITEGGYYSVNISRIEKAPEFMICKCNSFEEFPTEYIPHSASIVPEGVLLNKAMEEQVRRMVLGVEGSVYNKNALYGKKAIFDGDSICEGDDLSGWAGRIGRRNNMIWTNEGVSGGTITTGVLTSGGNVRHSVSANLDNIIATHSDLDYLILEGGTNDADLIFDKLGEISPDKCLHTDFDPTADFTQALEYTLSKAIATFPTKKIGFIVAHKMASANGFKTSNRRIFFDRCVEVCKKYGIPCLDLWNTAHLWGVIDKASHNGEYYMYTDGQHLSAAGYDYITDVIEAWMKTI